VVYSNKVFKIPREEKWSSKEFLACKKYGAKHGINKRYLDFWIQKEDKPTTS